MLFDRFIRDLARHLDLPSLDVDAQGGSCTLQWGELAISLVERPGEAAFLARSHLGSLDPAQADSAIERLLAACMFRQGASGAVVGIDSRGDLFLSQHFRHDGLSVARFAEWLERFARHALACRRTLAA